MRTVKILLAIILFSFQTLLFSQSYPDKIDLKSNNCKLDAKFFPTAKGYRSPAIILLHGFPGNQTSPLGLAEKLNAAGFNILVFNYQGSYLSEGDFSFDNCIENVGTAVHFLKNSESLKKYRIDTSRIYICGYSFGGTIALESAVYNNEIRNIISIANDDHSVSLKKAASDSEFREKYQEFIARSFGPEGPFRGDLKAIFSDCIGKIDRYDLVKNADKLKDRRILFIVGWKDKTSLIEINTLPLYRKLQELNAGDIAITGFESDHRFNNVRDDLSNAIINWINKQNVL
jgi:pimeloyl-ACP methyl ester carboxylesterase